MWNFLPRHQKTLPLEGYYALVTQKKFVIYPLNGHHLQVVSALES